MNDLTLFQLALGFENPWFVSSPTFDVDKKRLDIRIDFKPGSTFTCPHCGQKGVKASSRGFHSFESYRVRILFYRGKLDMAIS